jgi:hypothetical protein
MTLQVIFFGSGGLYSMIILFDFQTEKESIGGHGKLVKSSLPVCFCWDLADVRNVTGPNHYQPLQGYNPFHLPPKSPC